MRKIAMQTLWICLFASCMVTEADNACFNGTITYTYDYESTTMNVDSLKRVRPARALFSYDSLNYMSRFFGKDTVTYFYSGNMNKALEQINSNGNYTCEDYGLVTDSVFSVKVYPSAETILGQKCNILEMQKKNSWVKYYVSKEIKTAPSTYKKHRSYNMDVYGEKTGGGLILKLEHRFKNFTMKGLAVEVVKKDNPFKAFDIADTVFNNHCNN